MAHHLARWRIRIALFIGSIAGGIMVWTVLVPWNTLLIRPSIAGAELAPLFGFIGLVSLLMALPRADHRQLLRGLALAISALVLVAAGKVMVQVADTQRATAACMAAGFPDLDRVAPRTWNRAETVNYREVFTGLEIPGVTRIPNLTFASPDGQSLGLDIYRPETSGLHPVIMIIHGGGWSAGNRGESPTLNRLWASWGYVVLDIDYRLAPRFQFPAPVEDIVAALAWIRAHAADYGADASRIVLLGRSAGGALAVVAGYAQEAGIRGVVSYYGAIDLAEGYRNPGAHDLLDVRAMVTDYLGGTPDQRPERYAAASPLRLADRPRPPTLLIYGGRDTVVELRYAWQFRDALRASGTQTALLEVPWGEHSFDLVPHGLGNQITLYHLERFLAWATR